MAHVGDVFLVHGVCVGPLDPTGGDSCIGEAVADGLVGIHYPTFGGGESRTGEDSRHSLANAVLDAISGVYHSVAIVLEFLQKFDGAPFAAHVYYDVLIGCSGDELLFIIYIDLAAAFAQLFRH